MLKSMSTDYLAHDDKITRYRLSDATNEKNDNEILKYAKINL